MYCFLGLGLVVEVKLGNGATEADCIDCGEAQGSIGGLFVYNGDALGAFAVVGAMLDWVLRSIDL